jgi:hypothetical protein
MKRVVLFFFAALCSALVMGQKTFVEGTYKPECDAVSITFNKDLTFEANINNCEGYEKITGTYKVTGDEIFLTTKDFESIVMFKLGESKDQIAQTRINQLACGNCDEGDFWNFVK